MDVMQLRRNLLMKIAEHGLPSKYMAVGWLEGTGTQYIDSGIECTGDLVVDFKCKATTSVNSALCGGIDTRNASVLFRHHCSPQNRTIYWIQNGGSNPAVARYGENVVGIDLSVYVNPANGTAKVNQTNYTFTALSSNLTTGKNFGIFARIADTGEIQTRPAIIYYFKFYRNNQMIGDFVPCVRISDSKPGMYDLVSRQFFTNAGTGEFNTPT